MSAPATLGAGRYRLEQRLGIGGTSLVYRAHDTRLDRVVAVKLLADNLAADAQARARFLREARAAARLDHPNVVRVHDAGQDDERPWLVMEYVAGPTLDEVVRREGPLDPEVVAGIAAEVASALACAHDAGILHRDVKPANLIRAGDGTIKIGDFGVAEAAGLPALTLTGVVLGTPGYLAPERRAGEAASPAADLYGLGATLYTLLTGACPEPLAAAGTQAEEAAQPTAEADRGAQRAAGTEPAAERHPAAGRLRDQRPDIPAALAALIEDCLAAEPEARPASAADVVARLAEATDLPAGPGRDTPRPGRPAPPPGDTPPADPGTRVLDAAGVPTRQVGAEPDGAAPGEGVGAWRGAAAGRLRKGLIAAGLVLLALLAALALGDGGEQPAPATSPAGGAAEPGTRELDAQPQGDPAIPRSDDPTEQARLLAEWLRDQAGR